MSSLTRLFRQRFFDFNFELLFLSEIPAAILQDEFFSADRPQYMNYGAIGQIIGHEISHAFDDQGKQFDVDGNLVNWWQPETEERFLERARCIIEQYGNYTDTLTNLKVRKTIFSVVFLSLKNLISF